MLLNATQVKRAKRLRKKGLSYAEVADRMKVSEHSVYYALNRDKLLNYHRDYFKRWKSSHRGYMKRYLARWRKKNPEYFKKWREKNPDYFREYRRRKRKKRGR